MPTTWSRWTRLCLTGLLGSLAWQALGQTLTPWGSEFPLGLRANGDQITPAVAARPERGVLVWQDNAIDGYGQGIGAMRLGPDFAPLDAGRLVNQTRIGPQTLPAVALKTNGGAVITWQVGRGAFPGIYARFMGPAGRFSTSEIKVNRASFTDRVVFQTNWPAYANGVLATRPFTLTNVVTEARESYGDPAVAVLAGGDIIIAWSAARRRWTDSQQLVEQAKIVSGRQVLDSVLQPARSYQDSMQDVLFRRLSPSGQLLGAEVVANEFLSYNQRNPAVAALGNGRFVVVWVSEEQVSSSPSVPILVDIKARVFGRRGKPAGPEFRVNPVRGLCGSPAVAALGPDGFTVVWSQYEFHSDQGRQPGWYLGGRVFTAANPAAPEPVTPIFLISTNRESRQIVARLATAGLNQMVVWSSLGRDGSYEGVFGRLLSQGAPVGVEFQINQRTAGPQKQPAVAADGENRFLVAWSSIVRTSIGPGLTGFDLFGRVYLSAPPPPPLPAPAVTALGRDSLSVSWDAAPDPTTAFYELYMDGASAPVLVTDTQWLATGLERASTHQFRVRYVLADGQRSELSPPGSGTTLGGEEAAAAVGDARPAGDRELFGAGRREPGATAGLLRVGMNVTPLGRRLHWNTEPGGRYQVQCSTNLLSWTDVGAPRTATAAADALDVTNQAGAVFFRVLRLP